MRVVLLQDIKGVGKKHDIKNVSNGYGRNYLIARGLAKIADKPTVQVAKSKKESSKEELERFKETLRSIQESVSKDKLVIKVKTGNNNEMFESVTAEDIKKSLKDRGFENIEIEPSNIHIKEIGEHKVGINLGRGVKGEITLEIQP